MFGLLNVFYIGQTNDIEESGDCKAKTNTSLSLLMKVLQSVLGFPERIKELI